MAPAEPAEGAGNGSSEPSERAESFDEHVFDALRLEDAVNAAMEAAVANMGDDMAMQIDGVFPGIAEAAAEAAAAAAEAAEEAENGDTEMISETPQTSNDGNIGHAPNAAAEHSGISNDTPASPDQTSEKPSEHQTEPPTEPVADSHVQTNHTLSERLSEQPSEQTEQTEQSAENSNSNSDSNSDSASASAQQPQSTEMEFALPNLDTFDFQNLNMNDLHIQPNLLNAMQSLVSQSLDELHPEEGKEAQKVAQHDEHKEDTTADEPKDVAMEASAEEQAEHEVPDATITEESAEQQADKSASQPAEPHSEPHAEPQAETSEHSAANSTETHMDFQLALPSAEELEEQMKNLPISLEALGDLGASMTQSLAQFAESQNQNQIEIETGNENEIDDSEPQKHSSELTESAPQTQNDQNAPLDDFSGLDSSVLSKVVQNMMEALHPTSETDNSASSESAELPASASASASAAASGNEISNDVLDPALILKNAIALAMENPDDLLVNLPGNLPLPDAVAVESESVETEKPQEPRDEHETAAEEAMAGLDQASTLEAALSQFLQGDSHFDLDQHTGSSTSLLEALLHGEIGAAKAKPKRSRKPAKPRAPRKPKEPREKKPKEPKPPKPPKEPKPPKPPKAPKPPKEKKIIMVKDKDGNEIAVEKPVKTPRKPRKKKTESTEGADTTIDGTQTADGTPGTEKTPKKPRKRKEKTPKPQLAELPGGAVVGTVAEGIQVIPANASLMSALTSSAAANPASGSGLGQFSAVEKPNIPKRTPKPVTSGSKPPGGLSIAETLALTRPRRDYSSIQSIEDERARQNALKQQETPARLPRIIPGAVGIGSVVSGVHGGTVGTSEPKMTFKNRFLPETATGESTKSQPRLKPTKFVHHVPSDSGVKLQGSSRVEGDADAGDSGIPGTAERESPDSVGDSAKNTEDSALSSDPTASGNSAGSEQNMMAVLMLAKQLMTPEGSSETSIGTPGASRSRFRPSGDQEKIREDNRERKKRWRDLNAEKNKDNDLRSRVQRRAHVLFGGEDSREKREWIEQEFERRKQKRIAKSSAGRGSPGAAPEAGIRQSGLSMEKIITPRMLGQQDMRQLLSGRREVRKPVTGLSGSSGGAATGRNRSFDLSNVVARLSKDANLVKDLSGLIKVINSSHTLPGALGQQQPRPSSLITQLEALLVHSEKRKANAMMQEIDENSSARKRQRAGENTEAGSVRFPGYKKAEDGSEEKQAEKKDGNNVETEAVGPTAEVDGRVDGKVDGRVDGKVDGKVDGTTEEKVAEKGSNSVAPSEVTSKVSTPESAESTKKDKPITAPTVPFRNVRKPTFNAPVPRVNLKQANQKVRAMGFPPSLSSLIRN